jgi:hypothetical protein
MFRATSSCPLATTPAACAAGGVLRPTAAVKKRNTTLVFIDFISHSFQLGCSFRFCRLESPAKIPLAVKKHLPLLREFIGPTIGLFSKDLPIAKWPPPTGLAGQVTRRADGSGDGVSKENPGALTRPQRTNSLKYGNPRRSFSLSSFRFAGIKSPKERS